MDQGCAMLGIPPAGALALVQVLLGHTQPGRQVLYVQWLCKGVARSFVICSPDTVPTGEEDWFFPAWPQAYPGRAGSEWKDAFWMVALKCSWGIERKAMKGVMR